MTFETEMANFFARNCFTEAERKRVLAWRPYQVAVADNDVVQAQEIAMRVLELKLGISGDDPG